MRGFIGTASACSWANKKMKQPGNLRGLNLTQQTVAVRKKMQGSTKDPRERRLMDTPQVQP